MAKRPASSRAISNYRRTISSALRGRLDKARLRNSGATIKVFASTMPPMQYRRAGCRCDPLAKGPLPPGRWRGVGDRQGMGLKTGALAPATKQERFSHSITGCALAIHDSWLRCYAQVLNIGWSAVFFIFGFRCVVSSMGQTVRSSAQPRRHSAVSPRGCAGDRLLFRRPGSSKGQSGRLSRGRPPPKTCTLGRTALSGKLRESAD